jgi:NADH-quinone oxidoreductase subunit M
VLAILAIAVLLLGLWPAPLIDVMATTLQGLADHMVQSKL